MYVASRLASDELGEAAEAVVTQTDLAELERLNRGNIRALEEIVGHHGHTDTEHELRRQGPHNAPSWPSKMVLTFTWDTIYIHLLYAMVNAI